MGNHGGMDCIFCSIVEGAAPAWRIYEDEVAVRPVSTSDR